jgi:prolyl oligopeptidase
MRYTVSILAGACLASGSLAGAAPPPSAFPPGDTVDTIQGVAIKDPYRALENGDDPTVKAWSDAQNARARAYLDGLPGRAAVEAKLGRLIKAASPSFSGLTPRGDRIFASYSDPAKQQPWIVTLNASADPASRRDLIDPNAMDAAAIIAYPDQSHGPGEGHS